MRSIFTPEDTLLLPFNSYTALSSESPDGGRAKNIVADRALRQALGIMPVMGGGERGYSTEGDVLTQTVDGRDLNELWREFQATVAIRNADRQRMIDFLTYGVANPVVTVPQFTGGADFEVASEFGVPKSVRAEAGYFEMGFDFEWYDLASRFTWKFLAEATAEQVESVNQAALDADSRLVFLEVMRTLFRNTNKSADINQRSYSVYTFYNGDGTVPPPYKANTFDGTHNHFLVSGAAAVDSGDLDEMEDHLTHHGYSLENGTELILLANKVQTDVIRNFRSIANGGTAKYDFIPAQGQPGFLLPRDVVAGPGTTQAPATVRGMKVVGSYGQLLIVEEGYMPAGYMVAIATGGAATLTNPIGIREHANPALRGLRLVRGRVPDYPLQEAYYQRGFGTGVRQRGGAVVMQIKASGTYTIPAAYL